MHGQGMIYTKVIQMNINKINEDIFLIDDILFDDELNLIYEEMYKLKPLILRDVNVENKKTDYNRVYLDTFYINERHKSDILSIITKTVFSKNLLVDLERLSSSYTFQTMKFTTNHQTQLTVYNDGGNYEWHRDYCNGRTLSFVLPINIMQKETYDGGELLLKYSDNKIIKIKPKHNQLILFSAQLEHKVEPINVKMLKDNIFSGRVVINGHIGSVDVNIGRFI